MQNADEVVAQYDRRKLRPNNERLVDSFQQPTTQDAHIPIYKMSIASSRTDGILFN